MKDIETMRREIKGRCYVIDCSECIYEEDKTAYCNKYNFENAPDSIIREWHMGMFPEQYQDSSNNPSGMTDLEMDLMLAQAENANLKKQIEMLMGNKCSFGPGVTVKPNGVDELDPCIFEDAEVHTNVTVVVKRCPKCGAVELVWYTQENTESFVDGGWDG